MKKNILIICSNMEIGGFQKSLVSLLRCFDYQKYEVDLMLLNPSGIFMDLIPKQVNILPKIIDQDYFLPGPTAVFFMLKKKKLYLAIVRLISCIVGIFDKGIGAVLMMKVVPSLEKKYDAAVDYNGQHLLYYMVDKIRCRNKISYFHSDYIKWPFYVVTDRKYYSKVNSIVTVSEDCVNSMKRVFPEYSDKIYCIENIISDEIVNIFPTNSNSFTDGFDGIRIVTVGRVCKDKGLDFIFEAIHKLKEDEYKLRWYLVGPVTDKKFYDECVKKYGNCEELVFLGPTNNPYDYMRNADIIVQPSRFEGKAVSVEEAKILNKPIVATNYSTVNNQIIDGETGIIVDMNGEAVYKGVKRLIDDKPLLNYIIDRQKELCKGNANEVEKLYKLIEKEV